PPSRVWARLRRSSSLPSPASGRAPRCGWLAPWRLSSSSSGSSLPFCELLRNKTGFRFQASGFRLDPTGRVLRALLFRGDLRKFRETKDEVAKLCDEPQPRAAQRWIIDHHEHVRKEAIDRRPETGGRHERGAIVAALHGRVDLRPPRSNVVEQGALGRLTEYGVQRGRLRVRLLPVPLVWRLLACLVRRNQLACDVLDALEGDGERFEVG